MSEIIGTIIRGENGGFHVVGEDNRRLDLESTVTLADRLMPVRPVHLYFATFDERDSRGMVKCKYGVTDNLKRRQKQLGMKFIVSIAFPNRYDALEEERGFHDFLKDAGAKVQNEYFEAWIPLMIYIKRMILSWGGKVIDNAKCIDNFIINSSSSISFPCVDCDDYCYPYYINDQESMRHVVRTSLNLEYVYKCHACGAKFSIPALVTRNTYNIANAYGPIIPEIDITHNLEVRHSKTREKQIKQKSARRITPLARRNR